MANEITCSVYGNLANGTIKDQHNIGNVTITQAGKACFQDVMALTTSYAACGKGSVGNLGQMFITNVNAAGTTIQVSVDGGTTSLLTIAAGDSAKLPLTPGYTIANIQIKITAATGFAHYKIWEA